MFGLLGLGATVSVGMIFGLSVAETIFLKEPALGYRNFKRPFSRIPNVSDAARAVKRPRPAMSVLASNVAADVALTAAQGFVNFVGTPGTTPTSFLTYAQAGERLDWQTAPRDGNRAVVLNPTAMAATVGV